jgi:outer membrane protein
MTRTRSKWMLAAAFALASTGASAQMSPQDSSELHIQQLIKQAAERVASGQTTAAPAPAGTTQQTASAKGDTRPVVHLTLDDAVKDALDHNLDIGVQRLNPEINDIAIASIRSVYHPFLTSQIWSQSQTSPTNSTLAGAGTAGLGINSNTQTFNGGVAQSIPWGGGSYSVALNNNRQWTQSQNTLFNPTFNTNWSGTYTQPLLRGFKIDATRQQLAVTKINRDISDVQLRSTITNTLSNVRNAYWDYVFAVQSVDVAQQSVNLADQLVKDNQTRVEVGTMAPIDVVQAQSQAATQRQNLVAAQATRRTTELALKRLLVAGTNDPMWNSAIDPIDRPDFHPEPVDIEAAVRRALSERTDIAIAKQTVAENDVTVKYLEDQLKPQADFVGTYGLVGVGGPRLLFEPGTSGVNRTPIGSNPGGYSDALSTLFNNNYPRWTAQVNISYPLGTSSQEASAARARVQVSQVQAQLKQIELQVATDVTNAAVTVQSNVERVQAAQVARDLAQQTMAAEQSKFEVGMSTNYNVILTQRDLATAQNNELQAVLAYRKSLVELERLQQTTLSNLNITVVGTGTGIGTTNVSNGGGSSAATSGVVNSGITTAPTSSSTTTGAATTGGSTTGTTSGTRSGGGIIK